MEDIHGRVILDPMYRKYNGVLNDEFDYFVSRILPAIHPAKNKFYQRKHYELISTIYEVSDKAFGLLVIYNEHMVWKDQVDRQKKGESGKGLKQNKRFCNSNSGNKHGWTAEGIGVYDMLCRDLKIRREESKNMEILMRDKWARECGAKSLYAGSRTNMQNMGLQDVPHYMDEETQKLFDETYLEDDEGKGPHIENV